MRGIERLAMLGGLGSLLAMSAMDMPVMITPRGVPLCGGGNATYRAPRRTTLHATNGKRECARRLRQIARGSLRAENGLVSPYETLARGGKLGALA